ncbi:MAG: hypothetical protein KH135_01985 [Firmicutes bacterium]|nr:hypothetical protein [Bacillota bacterium]
MEINLKIEDNKMIHMVNNGVIYLLGNNGAGKTDIIKTIQKNINFGENVLINNLEVHKGEYEVILVNEQTQFTEEFKFTKNNFFRNLIYEDFETSKKSEDILKQLNLLLDQIDNETLYKVNRDLNKNYPIKLRLDINIDNLNEIINRFTEIYIDEVPLSKREISNSINRKLLYYLLFAKLETYHEQEVIVLIDNFDVFFDHENIIWIMEKLNQFHQQHQNIYFILASVNNIMKYDDNIEKYYHIDNNIFHLENFKSLLELLYLKLEYNKSSKNMIFEDFVVENEMLISKKDIDHLLFEIKENYIEKIGEIYINNSITLIKEKSSLFKNAILYKNDFEKNLYEEVAKQLNVKSIVVESL